MTQEKLNLFQFASCLMTLPQVAFPGALDPSGRRSGEVVPGAAQPARHVLGVDHPAQATEFSCRNIRKFSG